MKKILLVSASLIFFSFILNSCGNNNNNDTGSNSVVENLPAEVVIGTQVWAGMNLDVSTFRNGDSILHAKTVEQWSRAADNKQPAWCYYNNDPSKSRIYGKLYNWYAVNDPRGLAPQGWHVPSDEEWTILTEHLGGENLAGGKLKSTSEWNERGNGSNSSGFTGLPGGYRNDNGGFGYFGYYGYWWSSSESDAAAAWRRYLNGYNGKVYRSYYYKENGMSVRCVKD